MKRPAALKKPANSQSKKSKVKEENGECEEEPEQVEQEEEEQTPLTKKALTDHQAFPQESANLSDKQFAAALAKLPEKQQQCLWKKFEASRKASGWEDKYKKEVTGSGSLVRKKLGWWEML